MALFIFPSKTSPISKITGDLTEERITFSEAIFYHRNQSVWILGEFTNITHLKKIREDDYKFTPQLCALEIHLDTYQKNVKKGDKWEQEECKPSLIERALGQILVNDASFIKSDGSKAYEGVLHFESDPDITLAVLQGHSGFYSKFFPTLNEVPKQKTIDIESAYDFGEKKEFSGKTFKSASEVANERLNWFIDQLKIQPIIEANAEKKNTPFQEVCIYINEIAKHEPEMANLLLKLAALCLK